MAIINIIGEQDRNRLYCAGSFTKLLTTFTCLSFLATKYKLNDILDDDNFLDTIATTSAAQEVLTIFQTLIGSQFTIRDLSTFYVGLPYTFDLSDKELEEVDAGEPLKHHGIGDEQTFLNMCRTCITPVDPNRCKFHYSEIAIIFLGYFIEKAFDVTMESLYQTYVIDAFSLKQSLFSRVMPENVDIKDLSDHYDYPSITIGNHGYFCYSDGFFTTLNDQKKLLEQLLVTPVFSVMTNLDKARAASPTIIEGLTVEMRLVPGDILVGYEGLSYSGCNIWAYSTALQKGYLTTTDSEEAAYDIIYGKLGYNNFDRVPQHTENIYHDFIKNRHYEFEEKDIPIAYQGKYQRVKMNTKMLESVFTVGEHFIEIRNPDPVRYMVLYDHGTYRITCRDHMHGTKIGLYQAKSGNRYMMFDGTLYKKIK